ncbi:MAG: maleylpyruvate isomerase family mycothiol-dependent enzyme [Nocardioidaceae bacterium]
MDRLASYVSAWKHCAIDVEELLGSLDDEDWERQTDCPGWTVRDITAHLAAIESVLAGDPGPDIDLAASGARDVTSAYTDAGVEARGDHTPAALVAEFVDAVERRAAELDADPPTDPHAVPPHTPGGIGWDMQTLLRNRVIDLWVHEQDIRRAVRRPTRMDTPAAEVVSATFAAAMPFVIGKRAGAPPGTEVVMTVDGQETAYVVDPDGRCRTTEETPPNPAVRLDLDAETLTLLGAGRRDPLTVDVRLSGDRDLGERILRAMAVTT